MRKRFYVNALGFGVGMLLAVLVTLAGCGLLTSVPSADSCDVVLLRLEPIARTRNAFSIVLTRTNGNEVEGVYEMEDSINGSLGARQNHDTLVFEVPAAGTVTHIVYARRDSCVTAPVAATVPF